MADYKRAPITPLETPRLILRPLQESDAQRIQSLISSWNVVRYLSNAIPWPYPENGAAEFLPSALLRISNCEAYFWAILRKEAPDEGLIGVISIAPNQELGNRGFWLAERYWGQGFMTEASAAATDFAFDVLEMSELYLYGAVENVASHRLREKSGAEIVEALDVDYVCGRLPSARWRLTPEAWRANRHRFGR